MDSLILVLIIAAFLWLKGSNEPMDNATIQGRRDRLNKVVVRQSHLEHKQEIYDRAADQLEGYMQGTGTSTQAIFNLCKDFNSEELKAVFKAFGIRKNVDFKVFTRVEGDLFDWFEYELNGIEELGSLDRMKELWKPTKIWQ